MNRLSPPTIVDPAHPALPGHFPGSPVVPGAWLLTLVEAFCRGSAGANAVVSAIDHVRFRAPLRPGESFRIRLTDESDDRTRFWIERGETTIAEGRVVLRVIR